MRLWENVVPEILVLTWCILIYIRLLAPRMAEVVRVLPEKTTLTELSVEDQTTRVIESSHNPFLYHLPEKALAHDGIGKIQPGEFDLLRMMDTQLVEDPVIKGSVVLELERAKGVRNAFDGIRDAMREIIHRINAPRVAGAMM